MTLMQRKSPLIKVMFYVGMWSSSLCMRRLTLREKKKISPHPACGAGGYLLSCFQRPREKGNHDL